MKKTLYLANGYGFSKQQREVLLPQIKDKLTALGIEVWEPFSNNINYLHYCDDSDIAELKRVGEYDYDQICKADGFFAIVNGCPPDEGVMVELGIAIAKNKPRFLFRDDFRRSTDNNIYPINLMAYVGLGSSWKDYYYEDLMELEHPNKELIKWLKS